MRLRWTENALDELERIRRYIAGDDKAAAARWVRRIQDRLRLAARHPNAGRLVPELRRADVREVFVGTYRLVYLVESDVVLVLTVFEGHRSLADPECAPEQASEGTRRSGGRDGDPGD